MGSFLLTPKSKSLTYNLKYESLYCFLPFFSIYYYNSVYSCYPYKHPIHSWILLTSWPQWYLVTMSTIGRLGILWSSFLFLILNLPPFNFIECPLVLCYETGRTGLWATFSMLLTIFNTFIMFPLIHLFFKVNNPNFFNISLYEFLSL